MCKLLLHVYVLITNIHFLILDYFFLDFRHLHYQPGKDLGEASAGSPGNCCHWESSGHHCTVCKALWSESGSEVCSVHRCPCYCWKAHSWYLHQSATNIIQWAPSSHPYRSKDWSPGDYCCSQLTWCPCYWELWMLLKFKDYIYIDVLALFLLFLLLVCTDVYSLPKVDCSPLRKLLLEISQPLLFVILIHQCGMLILGSLPTTRGSIA